MSLLAGDRDVNLTRPLKVRSKRNPLQSGIHAFTVTRCNEGLVTGIEDYPKRYTIYGQLLLLPTNFATHSRRWEEIWHGISGQHRDELFRHIAEAFRKSGQIVTHIAINAPIAASIAEHAETTTFIENTVRSPVDLLPVYGDFGPSDLQNPYTADPTEDDFEVAYWASHDQPRGIYQIWAPRWTMFSRGNLSEKLRILGVNEEQSRFAGLAQQDLDCPVTKIEVLDMYVGIGYFALCYLTRGVKRVWGWDLNPWSLEGLRRGCEKNGWRCVVVKVGDDGCLSSLSAPALAKMILYGDDASNASSIRCVAFLGDNKWASKIIDEVRSAMNQIDDEQQVKISHVNLGLLPDSRLSWPQALQLLTQDMRGWLHVHENIEVKLIDDKAQEVVAELDQIVRQNRIASWQATIVHVEQVKTYAPGVMHCVFDVCISRSQELITAAS